MSLNQTAPTANAAENAAATAATPLDLRPDLFQREQLHVGVPIRTSVSGMSDAMRTIVWVTGVAFGVFAPGAIAQSALDTAAKQKNPAFQRLDANHDRLVSREAAKPDPAVETAFSQADRNKDGKLDEDERIKALSISQRETVAKIAVDGASGVKSVLNDLTVK